MVARPRSSPIGEASFQAGKKMSRIIRFVLIALMLNACSDDGATSSPAEEDPTPDPVDAGMEDEEEVDEDVAAVPDVPPEEEGTPGGGGREGKTPGSEGEEEEAAEGPRHEDAH